MRLAILLALGLASVVAETTPPATARVNDVRLTAEQISDDNGVLTLRGNVCVTFDSVFVYADEAVYDSSTGELTPQGHVRIQPRRHWPTSTHGFPADQPSGPTDMPLIVPPSPWGVQAH